MQGNPSVLAFVKLQPQIWLVTFSNEYAAFMEITSRYYVFSKIKLVITPPPSMKLDKKFVLPKDAY